MLIYQSREGDIEYMLKRDKPIWNAETMEAYKAVLKKKLKKASTIEHDINVLKGMFMFYNNFMNYYGFMSDEQFEYLREVLKEVGQKKYSLIDMEEQMSCEETEVEPF